MTKKTKHRKTTSFTKNMFYLGSELIFLGFSRSMENTKQPPPQGTPTSSFGRRFAVAPGGPQQRPKRCACQGVGAAEGGGGEDEAERVGLWEAWKKRRRGGSLK